jgi:hypothetical protein
MPYAPFHEYFPEVARRETRTITVFPDSEPGLPAADYGFVEMFCDEPGCDCRRVLFYVITPSSRCAEAVVAYGWEPVEYYAKWMKHYSDPEILAGLKGPCLNVGSPESALAPAILDLVRTVLLQDPAYVERVKRHYRMFRKKIDGPAKPARRRAKP